MLSLRQSPFAYAETITFLKNTVLPRLCPSFSQTTEASNIRAMSNSLFFWLITYTNLSLLINQNKLCLKCKRSGRRTQRRWLLCATELKTAWSEAVDDHLRNSYTNRKSDHLLVRRVVKSNKVKNRSVPKNRLFLKEKIKLKFSHQCTSQVFCIKIKTVQQYLLFMFEHRQPKSTRGSCQEHP